MNKRTERMSRSEAERINRKDTMIETFSNPQQSWGDSWTQGAINVVP